MAKATPTNKRSADRSIESKARGGCAVVSPNRNADNPHEITKPHWYGCCVSDFSSWDFRCCVAGFSSCGFGCSVSGFFSCRFMGIGKLWSGSRHSWHLPDSIAESQNFSASVKLNEQLPHLNVRTGPRMICPQKAPGAGVVIDQCPDRLEHEVPSHQSEPRCPLRPISAILPWINPTENFWRLVLRNS